VGTCDDAVADRPGHRRTASRTEHVNPDLDLIYATSLQKLRLRV
jgi:hypothetical protein